MREGLEGCSYSRQGNSFYSSSVTVCRSASSSRTPPHKDRPACVSPAGSGGAPVGALPLCTRFACTFPLIAGCSYCAQSLLRCVALVFFPWGACMGAGWRQSNSARMGNRLPRIFLWIYWLRSRSMASTVLAASPKAVSRMQPAPFLPKPSPGVPTISFSLSR